MQRVGIDKDGVLWGSGAIGGFIALKDGKMVMLSIPCPLAK